MHIFKSNTLVTDILPRRRIGCVKQVVEITSPTGPQQAQRQKRIRKRHKLYPLGTCLTSSLYQPNAKPVPDQSRNCPDQRRVNKFSVGPAPIPRWPAKLHHLGVHRIYILHEMDIHYQRKYVTILQQQTNGH